MRDARDWLVPDAGLWWRRWSTWLAALAGGVAAAMVAAPGMLIGLIGFFPAGARPFLAGAAFAICFIVPVLVRHLRQGGGKENDHAE
jgi:hypothetical protein